MSLLITANEVIERAAPDVKLDEGYIKDRYIEGAQLNYLRPLLGDDFYDLVVASPSSYSALLPYIKDMLAFYVIMDALPIIHVHITTRGVTTNSNQYSNVAGRDHRSDLVNSYRKWGDEYKDKLYRYLYDNTSTYTDWVKEFQGGNRGGIYIGK